MAELYWATRDILSTIASGRGYIQGVHQLENGDYTVRVIEDYDFEDSRGGENEHVYNERSYLIPADRTSEAAEYGLLKPSSFRGVVLVDRAVQVLLRRGQ